MAPALLWLLSVGVLSLSSSAQESYDTLPEILRIGVDLALENVNNHSSIKHHFLFFKSVKHVDEELGFDMRFISHHFNLKATVCERGASNSSSCQFRNDRPLINCAVCYKTFQGAIEEEPQPYVHCIHKPKLTEEMQQSRAQTCERMGYRQGGASLLNSIGSGP